MKYCRQEAARPKLLKSMTNIGTWNVRFLYITRKSETIVIYNAMNNQQIYIAKARWNDAGEIGLKSGKIILYSVHTEEHAIIHPRRGTK